MSDTEIKIRNFADTVIEINGNNEFCTNSCLQEYKTYNSFLYKINVDGFAVATGIGRYTQHK